MEPARRHDDDPRRGADGRDPHLLPVADVADRRPRRLLDELPPLRGGSDAHRPEDDRRRRRRNARRQASGRRDRQRRSGTSCAHTCAVCERTLLLGERATRYSPGGGRAGSTSARSAPTRRTSTAGSREGSPTTPLVAEASAGGARLPRSRRCSSARRAEAEPVRDRADAAPPLGAGAGDGRGRGALQREPVPAHGRRDREEPRRPARRASLPLSGTNPEVVITVAWDISWYQYRVVFDSGQPVGSPSAATRSTSSTSVQGAGTRASTTTAGSSPDDPVRS